MAVSVRSTEDVLTKNAPEYARGRYVRILDRVKESPQEKGFRRRDGLINAIDAIPVVGGTLLDILDRVMRNKALEAWVMKLLSRKR